MQSECLICERISQIKNNTNRNFIAELETGFVVLGDYQFYKGYTLFLCKKHVSELHELEESFKMKFLNEMSVVAEAVYKAFKPKKLNYEIEGNSEPHLHWHIFPRYVDDPQPKNPTWCLERKIRYSQDSKPDQIELEKLKEKILKEIKKLK